MGAKVVFVNEDVPAQIGCSACDKIGLVRRHFFTIVSVLSLVLCLATVVLWIRSYRQAEIVYWANVDQGERSGRGNAVTFERGEVGLHARSVSYIGYFGSLPKPGNHFGRFEFPPSDPPLAQLYVRVCCGGWLADDVIWNRFGFYLATRGETRSQRIRNWTAEMPALLPAILFCALPSIWLRRWRRQRACIVSARAAGLGLCFRCGYDLRATPNRCPECGAPP